MSDPPLPSTGGGPPQAPSERVGPTLRMVVSVKQRGTLPPVTLQVSGAVSLPGQRLTRSVT